MGEKPVKESAKEAQTTQQTSTTTKTTTTITTKSIGGDGAGETTKNIKAAKGDAGAKTRIKDWKKRLKHK